MMESGKRRARRMLSPEEKWEIFLEVTTQEISQADAARKYGVDVRVIIRLGALAKGRGVGRVRVGEAGAGERWVEKVRRSITNSETPHAVARACAVVLGL